MTKKEFDEILKRYSGNECSMDERAFIDIWFDNIQKEQLFLHPENEDQIKNQVWSRMVENLSLEKSVRKQRYSQVLRMAAVSIFLLGAAGYILFNFFESREAIRLSNSSMTEVNNKDSQVLNLKLSDGSRVTLDPGSKLRYPKKFGATREVSLEGEAFFEVVRDAKHPFLVLTSDMTTRVLGTSFRVKAYSNQPDITVAVSTGKVAVYVNQKDTQLDSNKHHLIIRPNQEIAYDKKRHIAEKKLVDEPKIIQPLPSMRLSFANTPVSAVFDALVKMYNVDIQYDKEGLSNCSITTQLLNEEFYERIQIICDALGAEYVKEGTSIKIISKNCK